MPLSSAAGHEQLAVAVNLLVTWLDSNTVKEKEEGRKEKAEVYGSFINQMDKCLKLPCMPPEVEEMNLFGVDCELHAAEPSPFPRGNPSGDLQAP